MSIGCKINLNYERPDWALVEALKEFPVANIERITREKPEIKGGFTYIKPGNYTWSIGLPVSETELERWQERRKLDRECCVGEEIAMLKKCGYESVECIYLCGKFAVIAARV